MKREELKKRLQEMGIREGTYNLDGIGRDDERFNLIYENGQWTVYYGEHGQRTNPKSFSSEEEACDYLLEKLEKIGERRMELPPFLPLGSVVMLKGGNKRIMIVNRALIVANPKGEKRYFDYGAIPFPYGLINDHIAYFQQENIQEIFCLGYQDEEETEVLKQLISFRDNQCTGIPRGSEDNW